MFHEKYKQPDSTYIRLVAPHSTSKPKNCIFLAQYEATTPEADCTDLLNYICIRHEVKRRHHLVVGGGR